MIPQETFYSGFWCVASQGMGKSNLLLHILSRFIQLDASIIVLDAKGDVSSVVSGLALGDRLITLSPTCPFAINPLDVPKTDIRRAVNQLEYLFGAIMSASVTSKQSALLRSILRALVMGFPEPTLHTIQDLITNGPDKYWRYIQQLPPDLQEFFTNEWHDYDATRSELKWRIRLVLENDLISKMFSAPRTRFRLSEAMNSGKVFVCLNSIEHLQEDGAAFLGRWVLSQVWAAAMQRQSLPKDKRKPTFVFCDEAHLYLDRSISQLIDLARSANVSMLLSHQRSKQIEDPNVLSALENCAIKFANVDAEAAYFSNLLHIPEERMNQLKTGQFAKHVRGEGSEIVEIPVYEYQVERMDEAQLAAHQMKMHERYGFTEKFTAEAQEASGTKEPEASRQPLTSLQPLSDVPETDRPIITHEGSSTKPEPSHGERHKPAEADKGIIAQKTKSKTKWKKK